MSIDVPSVIFCGCAIPGTQKVEALILRHFGYKSDKNNVFLVTSDFFTSKIIDVRNCVQLARRNVPLKLMPPLVFESNFKGKIFLSM